jgi:hypothetical protein
MKYLVALHIEAESIMDAVLSVGYPGGEELAGLSWFSVDELEDD